MGCVDFLHQVKGIEAGRPNNGSLRFSTTQISCVLSLPFPVFRFPLITPFTESLDWPGPNSCREDFCRLFIPVFKYKGSGMTVTSAPVSILNRICVFPSDKSTDHFVWDSLSSTAPRKQQSSSEFPPCLSSCTERTTLLLHSEA